MPKPLRFMQHALDVIVERQLDLSWVERTVFEPQWQEVDPRAPDVLRRFRIIPERENRYLRVACVETSTEIRIISAFLDRGAKPK